MENNRIKAQMVCENKAKDKFKEVLDIVRGVDFNKISFPVNVRVKNKKTGRLITKTVGVVNNVDETGVFSIMVFKNIAENMKDVGEFTINPRIGINQAGEVKVLCLYLTGIEL